ncbi:hypothetical protein D3C87_1676090 [compost metagenome]
MPRALLIASRMPKLPVCSNLHSSSFARNLITAKRFCPCCWIFRPSVVSSFVFAKVFLNCDTTWGLSKFAAVQAICLDKRVASSVAAAKDKIPKAEIMKKIKDLNPLSTFSSRLFREKTWCKRAGPWIRFSSENGLVSK